jgi:tetratricopeptide (TPR) repeat protein
MKPSKAAPTPEEDQREPRRTRWLGWEWLLLLVPILAVTASLTLSYLWNLDFWWYLSSGRYLLEHRQFPSTDPFLYTAAHGIGWVYHSWLWTVLVALIDRLAGLGGVVVFHALIACALCAVVYTTARIDRWGLVNALAVTLFLVTIGPRLCGKAEVATWLMLAVFYRLLDPGEPFTWKRGAMLGTLQVLWANLHGGYPLGVFIALCYSAGGWLEARLGKKRTAARAYPPLWFPAVLFLLAIADPRLFRERLAPFAFVTGSESVQPVGESGKMLITEWQSPFQAAATDPSLPWVYVLAAGVGLASFAVVRRRRPVGRFLFLLGMAVLGATAVRHLPGLGLSAALVLLGNLAERETRQPALEPKRKRKAKAAEVRAPARWRYAAAAGLLAAVLLAAAIGLRVARPGFEGGQSRSFFTLRPSIACPQAASFILDHQLPGPIFNDYLIGAYLGARLYPKYRLFIDARVLDPAVVVRYTEMVGSPARFAEAERRYGFRTVVLGNFSKTVRSPLGQALAQDPRWRLVYLDPLAVIYVKDAPGVQPAVRLRLEGSGDRSVPFVEPAGLVSPLAFLQRLLLRDFPANYLIEYLAVVGQLGHPDAVVELATEALKSMPREPLLYRQRCAAHLVQRDLPAALEDCDAAYEQRPDEPQVAALYVTALAGSGRRAEALSVVSEALRKNPHDETLLRLRSRL